jgi:YD repeat-containing protein
MTTEYDLLNRPTKRTYPDTTFDETVYDKLDAVQARDRLGRWSRTSYDATRRLTAIRDPSGRTITQEWCGCGSLDALVDADGNRTRWERDVRGRVTNEIRANGSETLYVYENTTSRLKSVTDAKGQVTTYTYAKDDQLTNLAYTNQVIATPDVAFTYDTTYGRLATMVDGTGTTTYGYNAVTTPPALGAGRLASVDGPLTNDTITYGYDELGRVTTRAINGAANTVSWAFDSLGRVTSEQNVLGTFAYTYYGTTDRLNTVTYPNSQTSTYSYFGGSNDHRLQTIHHKYPNASTLSKFDYTYDTVGNILSWRQQADTTAVLWEYGYDRADQLTGAVKKADPAGTVLKRYGYSYDPAGNRTAEQIDDGVTGASYDSMNRLVSQQAAGPVVFSGTVNEPATVTVQGKPATVKADNTWQGTASVTSGTNTVTVVASDPSGNVRTSTYEVTNTATAKTFTYDANGNLASDQHLPLTITDSAGQTTTYTYNTAGQVLTVTNAKSETTTYAYSTPYSYLTSVTGPVTGATTGFTYDAYGRARTVTDSDGYTVTTDYDLLNRPTKRTYPDTTFDETIYDKLDAVQARDRLGRWSRTSYDAVRRVTAMRDPAGRTVTQEWCVCGSLDALVDANGNRTRWERDVRGRITKEIRTNGSESLYVYENTTSRLKSVTDAKGQVTAYTYAKDDRLTNLAYTNEAIATPDVAFTYDSVYGRLATMVDGTGTTIYGYHAVTTPPALGATRLASVDGLLPNDTITYSYDEPGHVMTCAIYGHATTVTWTVDASAASPRSKRAGDIRLHVSRTTARLNTVAYPNDQTTTYMSTTRDSHTRRPRCWQTHRTGVALPYHRR